MNIIIENIKNLEKENFKTNLFSTNFQSHYKKYRDFMCSIKSGLFLKVACYTNIFTIFGPYSYENSESAYYI